MIPKQLITQLNSGRCFALIGSGPSTAMGYPSWQKLAQTAASFLPDASTPPQTKSLVNELLSRKRFPELFDVIADSLGGMTLLAERLKHGLRRQRETGQAYEFLARWPIRCYLTTNYDDEIDRHLKRIRVNYALLNNSQPDLAQIGAYTNERIVRLHGDLDYVDGLVLGERQYREFKNSGRRLYFQEKLKSIFSMVPVVVVGHSLTDPDLAQVLETACELNSLDRPIYMILSDVSLADSRKYREQFNVELLSYDNPDRTHANLIRLLRQIDRFVIPRTQCVQPPLDFPDAQESRVATSLYLFAKLGLGTQKREVVQRAIVPQVLATAAADPKLVCSDQDLKAALLPPRIREYPGILTQVKSAANDLFERRLLRQKQNGVQITESGLEKYAEVTRGREVMESQVVGLLQQRLTAVGTGATKEIHNLVDAFQKSLVGVFRQRGLAASSMLFQHKAFEPADMPELFETVMGAAASVANFDLRAAFSDFVMDLLTKPTQSQREYLANLSQGFFAFHIFGADPAAAESRRLLAQEAAWILDSNILLPLVAAECHLHEFAVDLIARMRMLDITPLTTGAFVTETFQSYQWAVRQCCDRNPTGSHEAILQLVRDPNYSDNLFVDGYIEGSAKGRWNAFDDYRSHLGIETRDALEAKLAAAGVVRRNVTQFDGYTQETLEENERLVQEIVQKRTSQGTLRGGETQASAEAEVLEIIRGMRNGSLLDSGKAFRRAYFVSTSRLLDAMYGATDGLITWLPENLYRHLHFLTADTLDAERAFEAMTSNYYAIGVEIIDEQAYRAFFSPVIGESRVILERERESYEAAVEADIRGQQEAADRLLERFEATPDLDKPRFAAQAGWVAARYQERLREAAEERARRAEEAKLETERQAKKDMKRLEAEYKKRDDERKRHEEGRLRNLRDPKHIKKLEHRAKRRKKRK